MIIHKIKLHNIRSYQDQEIELGEGITLFEGDIGSGKTTILMSIDFALFGNSTPDFYKSLLRKGANSGYVEIEFEHNGERYIIRRVLENKGRGISNTESTVITPEGKVVLSAVDVRNYVLKLMGLDVDKEKRKSLPVVKYAIYTPQETMKVILEGTGKKEEERLDVIRKIFKLDEYKIARENIDLVYRDFTAEYRTARDKEEEIERIEEDIKEKKESIKNLNEELDKLNREISNVEKEYQNKKREWENITELRGKYEALRREIGKIEVKLAGIKENINKEKKELEEIESMKKRMEEIENYALRYEELEKRREELERKYNDILSLEAQYRRVQERIKILSEKVKKIEGKRQEIEELLAKKKIMNERIASLEDLENEKRELEEKRASLRGKIEAINSKMEEVKLELEDYKSLGAVCPKCKRPLSKEDKDRLIMESSKKLQELKDELKNANVEEAKIKRSISELEREIKELRELAKELASIEERIKRLKDEIEEGENAKKEIEKERKNLPDFKEEDKKRIGDELNSIKSEVYKLRELWKEYNSLKKSVEKESRVKENIKNYEFEYSKLSKELIAKKNEIKSLNYSPELFNKIDEEYREIERKRASLKKEIEEKMGKLQDLKRDVEKKREIIGKLKEEIKVAKKRGEFGEWLKSDLKNALEDIERHRLIAINEEFRQLFEQWFREILGESEYEASIDEDFKPVVRYQKFDMPIYSLSGGERTSIALAYRLALNTMVKKSLELETNLLILDEPTDGFSKDQLYKLKDIFNKMDTDQIIIVSHEKELMNLADTVYHVEKIDGVSSIKRI